MTNTVLIKRSATANTVPTAGQLANGEIAINYADGNLFFKDSGGSVQTLASKKFVSVTGNITGGNVETGIVSATGNVTAGNLNAAGLSLSSNVVSALTSAANITTTANIAGGYFIGNGSQLTGLPASYNDANVATFLSNFGSNTVSTTGNVTTGNLTVNGNITYVNSNVVTINDKFINVANNAATSGAANGGGLGVGPVDAEYATLTFNNGTTAWNTNIPLSVNGNVAGSYFVGNGSALTSITGASVTGNVANATYAVSAGSAGSAVTAEQVTFAVQANITGVGTLGNLSVSGNTTVGNLSTGGFVSATGNVTGNVFIGNGSQLTGITTSYGNANVVANLAALGSNPVSTTGNVTGNYILGNGSQLSNLLTVSQYTTGNVSNVVPNVHGLMFDTVTGFSVTDLGGGNALITLGSTFKTWEVTGQTSLVAVGEDTVRFVAGNNIVITTNALSTPQQITFSLDSNVSVTGNVTGANINGNGSGLSSITGANVTGTVANATYATSSGSATTADTVTGNAQANITSVGVLSSLSVSGNIIAGNLNAAGMSLSSNVVSALNVTGAIAGANLTTPGVISATGNITGGNLITAAAVSAASVSASGNITGGNILGGANVNATTHTGTTVSVTGNITGGNLNAAGLSLSSNVVSALVSAANITTTANISGGYILGNGSQLTGLAATYGNANVVANLAALGSNPVSTTGNVTGGNVNVGNITIATDLISSANATITIDPATVGNAGLVVINGNLQVNGTTTTINSNVVSTNDLTVNYANNAINAAAANGGGIEIGPIGSPFITWLYNSSANVFTSSGGISAVGNITAGNILGGANVNATTHTGDTVSVTGNITGGNILGGANVNATTHTGATVSVTGNVNGGNLISAALVQGVTVSASGNVVGGNVTTGGLTQTATLSVTGNVIGGNVLTGGAVSATGNITGGNILGGANVNATTHTGTTVSVSGNITGGNVLVGTGIISTSGNVSTGNLIVSGSISDSAQLDINTTSANANIVLTPNGTGNVNTPANLSVTGNIYTTGNVNIGNADGVTWANASGVRAWTYYNNATASLDTVFL